MRILFVAMAHSVHTARWILQLPTEEWDIHIFSVSGSTDIHSILSNVTVHLRAYAEKKNPRVRYQGLRLGSSRMVRRFWRRLRWDSFESQVRHLRQVIRSTKPDIVHSLETQHAGYLVAELAKDGRDRIHPWIHTNWGSDIYLFGRMDEHVALIRSVLVNCDFYTCECNRDVDLARKFGFRGKVLGVIPNGGGYDLRHVAQLRKDKPKPSERRIIMLKAYQGWAGRALTGLRALARASESIQGYKIVMYSNRSTDILIAARLFEQMSG
jgi:hypothetical protein